MSGGWAEKKSAESSSTFRKLFHRRVMMKSLGDKIFEYTRPELERNVDQFLRSLPMLRDRPPPVSPEVILDQMPDVKRLEVMPLLASKFDVEAMVLSPTFMHRHLTVVV